MAVQCSMTTNPSICMPILPLHHSDNRIKLKYIQQSRRLSVPLSGFHYNAGSRQNTTGASFQCQCTNKESLADIETFEGDLGPCTQFVPNLLTQTFNWMFLFLGPIKDAISILNNKWVAVVLNPIRELLWLKREPRNVLFNELIGVDHIIRPFRRYICILQGNSAYKKYNVRLPYGVLLFGPPGTGKTTLVHAMAHEAKMAFFPLSARDVATPAGAVRIVKIFNEARRRSPSIVFVEDLDIIGGEQRNSESDVALEQLLSEMDKGHYKKDGRLVLVVAATNRVESLDEELRDYSNFSTSFHVAKPNEDCRRKMFGLYIEEFILEEDKEAICILVAKSTPGLVWGDLQEIGDESTRLAARRGGHHVTIDDVHQAIERVNGNLRIDER
ncbi:ATPase, AAA-type, core, P-loop containing nucleoside triphosphate hydrolase [Tanacetum coccineum]